MAEPSGFKNIEPKTREARYEDTDKNAWEKARIKDRSAAQRKEDIPLNPVVPAKSSPAYIDERDRFKQDSAGYIQKQKEENLQRKQIIYERRRAEKYEQEQSRWDVLEQKSKKKDDHFQHVRDTGIGGKSNQSSQEYNILTLDYKNTAGGQALRHKDESVLKKAELRSENLYKHGHSVSHNIITGEPLKGHQPFHPAI